MFFRSTGTEYEAVQHPVSAPKTNAASYAGTCKISSIKTFLLPSCPILGMTNKTIRSSWETYATNWLTLHARCMKYVAFVCVVWGFVCVVCFQPGPPTPLFRPFTPKRRVVLHLADPSELEEPSLPQQQHSSSSSSIGDPPAPTPLFKPPLPPASQVCSHRAPVPNFHLFHSRGTRVCALPPSQFVAFLDDTDGCKDRERGERVERVKS